MALFAPSKPDSPCAWVVPWLSSTFENCINSFRLAGFYFVRKEFVINNYPSNISNIFHTCKVTNRPGLWETVLNKPFFRWRWNKFKISFGLLILKLGCTLNYLVSFKNYWCPSPTPLDSDFIAMRCSLSMGSFNSIPGNSYMQSLITTASAHNSSHGALFIFHHSSKNIYIKDIVIICLSTYESKQLLK